MGLLTSTYAEDFAPGGALLPEGWYLAEVEQAAHEESAAGKQLTRRYGSLRNAEGQTEFTLPDGSTFRIGNRKAFARSWTEHSNPKAQEIGRREIKREAAAVGLMEAPVKGGPPVELEFPNWDEYAATLQGKTVKIRVKHKPKFHYIIEGGVKRLERVLDDDGSPAFDIQVADWMGV